MKAVTVMKRVVSVFVYLKRVKRLGSHIDRLRVFIALHVTYLFLSANKKNINMVVQEISNPTYKDQRKTPHKY